MSEETRNVDTLRKALRNYAGDPRDIHRTDDLVLELFPHDEALRRIMDAVEMPDRLAENLVMFIRQNSGRLPARRRKGEFQKLGDDEVTLIENIVNDAFIDFDEPRSNGRNEPRS